MADKTGDKSGSESDSDNERRPRREQIPDAVDHFLGQLFSGLETRNVPELTRLYEDDFNKLTEKHYKSQKWPSVEAVQEALHPENDLLIIFYKELYYRHIYARLQTQHADRIGSWENYCKLLDLIIDDLQEGDVSFALPAQWIW